MSSLNSEEIALIKQQIESLPEDADSETIEKTAHHLEKINYQPTLMAEPPDFLRITKDELLSFIDNQLVDKEALTEQSLSLLLHHYRLLQRLRNDDPEAWDEVSEVTEED